MKPIRRLCTALRSAALAAAVGLSGCALQPAQTLPPVTTLLADSSFAAPTQPISADAVMQLSPAMQRYLDEQIRPRLRHQNARDALLGALYTRSDLQLLYDDSATRTAAQAFEARAGNCLSLVMMTAAFADAMGLPYRFQAVQVGEVWGREGNLVMFMGHVNIALQRHPLNSRDGELLEDHLVVDFLPTADLRHQFTEPITKLRIQAMYMNNMAAEALSRGQLDNAYWWARGAVLLDPQLDIALNTLGVVHLRHGQPSLAEATFRQTLSQDPNNRHAMSNLVQALNAQDRTAEALALADRLRRLQLASAYGQFELGQTALQQHQFQQAKGHFERAVRMDREQHEFHYALAQTLAHLGQYEDAARELTQAQAHSGNALVKQRYASKLQRLREQLAH